MPTHKRPIYKKEAMDMTRAECLAALALLALLFPLGLILAGIR